MLSQISRSALKSLKISITLQEPVQIKIGILLCTVFSFLWRCGEALNHILPIPIPPWNRHIYNSLGFVGQHLMSIFVLLFHTRDPMRPGCLFQTDPIGSSIFLYGQSDVNRLLIRFHPATFGKNPAKKREEDLFPSVWPDRRAVGCIWTSCCLKSRVVCHLVT